MTPTEFRAGVAAAIAYEGWEADFIGEANNEKIVTLIVTTADAAADQSATGRQTAAVAAVTAAVDNAGYGDEVSAEMISGITAAVLAAIGGLRAQHSKPWRT